MGFLSRFGGGVLGLAVVLLFGGCVKEKHAFTIFSDGSGKVEILASRNTLEPALMKEGQTLVPFDFEWYVNNSAGIVAWTRPVVTEEGGWRTHRFTAYFEDLNAVRLPVLTADVIYKSEGKPALTAFEFKRNGERCSLRVVRPLAAAVVPADPKGFQDEAKPQPRDAGIPVFEKKYWKGFEVAETYRMPGKIVGQEGAAVEFKIGPDDIFQKGDDPKHYWNVDRLRELSNTRTRNLESGIDPASRAAAVAFQQELARAKGAWEKGAQRAGASLIRAVKALDPKGVKQALQDGADANATFRDGVFHMTPLEMAAQKGDLVMIAHLLDHGADPNKRAGEYTPLHSASAHGQIQAIELLLKRGAKVQGLGKRTVLDIAVLNRQKEATQFWVQHGVPVTDLTWHIAKSTAKFDKAHRTTAGKEILDWLEAQK